MCCLQPPYVGHFPSAHKEHLFKVQNNDVVAIGIGLQIISANLKYYKLSDNNFQV